MKRSLSFAAIFLSAAAFVAPAYAQDAQPKGQPAENKAEKSVEESAEAPEGEDLDNLAPSEMSSQQLLELAKQLAAKISSGLEEMESNLQKASLPERSPAEIKAEVQAMLDALSKGKADAISEDFKKLMLQNTEKLSEATGKSVEELKSALNDSDAMTKLLEEQGETMAKMLGEANQLEEIIKLQMEVERNVKRMADLHQSNSKKVRGDVDQEMEYLYELGSR